MIDHAKYFQLNNKSVAQLKSLRGPIAVFGAGGFIGVNLLHFLLQHRDDVFGISHDKFNNWRFSASGTPHASILSCDINDFTQLKLLFENFKPQTIFNLAAYGAYSKQKEYKKIYFTNFDSSIDIIELLKGQGFSAYIHAGSSSEYGLNSAGPKETDPLIPNSHYAVSKTAMSYAIKYYGLIEKLPVANLRLYSAYGPWEEPDRLMPMLISSARNKKFPPLVEPKISRDFIYISDICSAFIASASAVSSIKGMSLNIGSGNKTTISEIVSQVKEKCGVPGEPVFGSMDNRNWDKTEWYANIDFSTKQLEWRPEVELQEGIEKIIQWQNEMDFDNAFWNYTRQL
ncbi:MAG: NAD-dependent epimerase/dehydratase family protein [Bacteroidota bacterium]